MCAGMKAIGFIMVVLPESRVPGSNVTLTSMSHSLIAVKGQELLPHTCLAIVLFFFHF
jgi:hypothetical protein